MPGFQGCACRKSDSAILVMKAPRVYFGTVWSSTTMFVRWQEYKSRAKSRRLRAFRKKHGPHRLRAILVETVRIDGKPHQRYLAYLGSVQADRRDRPRFWYGVTRKLDHCRLSREQRNRIASAIAKKIGGKVPTKAGLKKFKRRQTKLMG